MIKNMYLTVLSIITCLSIYSCETTDLPPATQMQLEQVAVELSPYYEQYDTNGDDILDEEELAEIPPDELARVEELVMRFEEIYRQGINDNTTMFVQFLRQLGIPAPPGSEIPAGAIAALFFRRPRRQLIATLKHLSPSGGGPSFYEAGRSLLSIVGLLDSTETSKEVAEKEVAEIKKPNQEQLNG